jgi:DNA-binding beta-propeller fold protein YncE
MTPTHMIGKSVPKRSGPTGPGLSQVHGVLVVPGLHRVYATATGTNRVVRIDEDTGRVLGGTATGAYPDGLAYDPANGTIWITNESGGSETIVDAATGVCHGGPCHGPQLLSCAQRFRWPPRGAGV